MPILTFTTTPYFQTYCNLDDLYSAISNYKFIYDNNLPTYLT